MKYGLTLPHFRQVASPLALQRVAREAEAMGYDSLWVTDHIVMPHPYVDRFGAHFYDPLTTLGYVIPYTRRIRLGSSVFILPYRNPIFMAQALATLDILSNGRLLVGVAAGWCQEEFRVLGVPFERRGDLTDESIRIFKALWTQEDPVFRGQFWTVEGVKSPPHPVQKPHPPIYVGGNSKRAQRRAVELGDGWHPTRPSPEDVKAGLEYLRRLAEQRGRSLEGFEVIVRQPMRITDTPTGGARPLIGTLDEVKRAVEAYREAGATYLMMDTFYSVPELNDVDLDGMLRSMERFARAFLAG